MYKAEIDLNASKMSIRFSKLVWGYNQPFLDSKLV